MQDDLPALPPTTPDWSGVRHADQARTEYHTCLAVLGFYLIDAVLMALFCASGVGDWSSPAWFVVTGLVVAGGGGPWIRHFGAGRLGDPGMVIAQAGSALTLTLGVALFDPAFLTLMLITVIVIIPTAALGLHPRGLLLLCIVTAVAAAAVVTAHDGRLTVPSDSTSQRLLSGLFLLWTLAKGASVNVAGMALRMQLDDSHERLTAALARVQQMAEVDELTGLPNRRAVLAALAHEQERHRRSATGFSVAMLDIDHFKRVNDRFGHPVGDVVLQRVAQLMRGTLRTPDVVGRLGGEEFLMILPGAGNLEMAQQAAERVRSAIEINDWSATKPDLHVTASIGVAVGAPDEPVESLIDRADRGLYRAKEAGRNQVVAEPGHTERDGVPTP
ncbi:MAG: GGDEF domain-containing protein [Burkholderiales bacterium]